MSGKHWYHEIWESFAESIGVWIVNTLIPDVPAVFRSTYGEINDIFWHNHGKTVKFCFWVEFFLIVGAFFYDLLHFSILWFAANDTA